VDEKRSKEGETGVGIMADGEGVEEEKKENQ